MSRNNNTNHELSIESISAQKRMYIKLFTSKINILYKGLPIDVLAVLIASSVIYFFLPHVTYIRSLTGWYIFILLISGFRLGSLAFYQFFPNHSKLHLIIFIFSSSLAAAGWGTLDSLMMPMNDQVGQMIIVIIIALVSSGAIQTLQANLIASILFSTIVIVPLCFWLHMQNGIEYFALLLTMIGYYAFIIISAIRANFLLTRSLQSDLTNLLLLEEVSESNQNLKYKNLLLNQHEHDMSIINKMNKTLQLCQNSAEAYLAIKSGAELLFHDYNGGLTITDSLNNQQLTAQWGSIHALKSLFPSTACWALRSGNQYKVMDQQADLICQHYVEPIIGHSICLPLIVHNNVLGMLNFNMTEQWVVTKHTKQMMTIFADAIKFALANIILHEKLQQEASHDPLTNLYNRRYLNAQLERELQLIARNKSTLCIAALDIDHFKIFNDNYGHEAGDEVLKHIGQLLINKIRVSDIACRYGGEEFVLVFSNTQIKQIVPFLEHLCEDIRKAKIYYHNELMQSVTVSIGVAQAPQHGTTADQIIKVADEALYAAKKAGRDRIVIAQQ